MNTSGLNTKIFKKEQRKNKLIILGTGSCYEYCKLKYSIDIENEVLFFVESNVKTELFCNKKVINYVELEQYLEHAEYVDILVCTTAWEAIQNENDFIHLYKHGIHPLYIETLFDQSALLTFHQPFLNLIRQGENHEIKVLNPSKFIILIKEFKGAALVYHHLIIGILLKIRGYDVEYLFCDESKIGDFLYGEGFNEYQNQLLLNVLEEIQAIFNINYHLLSDQKAQSLTADQQDSINRVIYYNLVWSTKKVVFDPKDEKVNRLKQSLWESAQKMNGFIDKQSDITSFSFTGMHHEWAIWFELASLAKKGDVFTFERVANRYAFDKNSPAIYRRNIFKEVNPRKVNKLLIHYDFLKKERVKIDHKKPVVVIPLNIFWDSASYTEHDIYLDFGAWLIRTIDYLLNECQAIVYVRQHPHESKFHSGRDVQQLLFEHFGQISDYHFIDCNSPVDTYDLVYNSDLVLPNTSTVGIEAVMMGKPVVLKNDVYYGEYGFTHTAYNEQEYHALIQGALQGKLSVSKEQIEAASNWFPYIFYNGRDTYFGHSDEEIDFWIRKPLSELLQDTEVNTLLDAIIERKPYSDWDSLFRE
ncbi:hypothetical protein L2089_18990 [Paenibacillus hunanensis]|uniref:capsular polysaccharide export protein, LipB/KpsS family n=1 Tax=Paenibacillus hunanensis TaxID=539262 RepID=UPI002025ECA3|nr:hypothetical protein [Paenibacillus hunanensis]MCL9662779.1 hypothetical protein [Paenibacillus hunanensis]